MVPGAERRRIDSLASGPAHPPTGGVSDAVSVDDIPVGLEQARIAAQAHPGRLAAFAELGTFECFWAAVVPPNYACWQHL